MILVYIIIRYIINSVDIFIEKKTYIHTQVYQVESIKKKHIQGMTKLSV